MNKYYKKRDEIFVQHRVRILSKKTLLLLFFCLWWLLLKISSLKSFFVVGIFGCFCLGAYVTFFLSFLLSLHSLYLRAHKYEVYI
jgi:hypothetical protein